VALLEVSNLSVRYGGVEAVRDVSFSVDVGGIVALIGANGAGKSSTLLALSGLVRPWSGAIRFAGEDITGVRADRIVRTGLVHVPEGRAILRPLSVEENLELGAWTRRDEAAMRAARDRVYGLFPRLAERRRLQAGSLSGGEQQMLAIGRALMSSPKLLLLDEPSLGLAPILVKQIFDIIREINSQGVSILLVEQNAHKALSVARRGYVLENGRIAAEGPAEALKSDEKIQEAYLGGAALKRKK
jgi:branched-chain amino acid transport system ATP-binding protein